jgi:hypothetical protein
VHPSLPLLCLDRGRHANRQRDRHHERTHAPCISKPEASHATTSRKRSRSPARSRLGAWSPA